MHPCALSPQQAEQLCDLVACLLGGHVLPFNVPFVACPLVGNLASSMGPELSLATSWRLMLGNAVSRQGMASSRFILPPRCKQPQTESTMCLPPFSSLLDCATRLYVETTRSSVKRNMDINCNVQWWSISRLLLTCVHRTRQTENKIIKSIG